MSVIGSIAVNVVMKTGRLARDAAKARKSFKRTEKAATELTRTMRRLGGVIATGALARGFFKTAQGIDATAKAARRLGIAVEDFQGLQHAADQTAGSSDGLATALQRLGRRTAEAANGTGEAVKAIKELGLDAERLSTLTVDEQFMRISRAMKQVKNQGDQLRLTQKLLDSEGVKFLNTLNAGEEALRKYNAEARKFGFTDDQARQVEKMNDQIDLLTKSIKGLGVAMTAELAGENVFGRLATVADEFAQFTRGGARNAAARVNAGDIADPAELARIRRFSQPQARRTQRQRAMNEIDRQVGFATGIAKSFAKQFEIERSRQQTVPKLKAVGRGLFGGFLQGTAIGQAGQIGAGLLQQVPGAVRSRIGRFRREMDVFQRERAERLAQERDRQRRQNMMVPTQTGAIEANTAAGFRALREARNQDVPKKQLHEQKETNKLLRRQNGMLDKIQIETV